MKIYSPFKNLHMYSPNDILISITPIWNKYGGIKILPNQEYRVVQTVSDGTSFTLDVEYKGDIIKDVSPYRFYSLKEKMMFGMCLQNLLDESGIKVRYGK